MQTRVMSHMNLLIEHKTGCGWRGRCSEASESGGGAQAPGLEVCSAGKLTGSRLRTGGLR